MRVLAADIGGTHARLALFEVDREADRRPVAVRQETYASERFEGLEAAVEVFRAEAGEAGPPEAACLAVAGPVVEGDVPHLPNLDWAVRDERLAEALGGIDVRLINDFDAVGRGLAYLTPDEVAPLQEGQPRERTPMVAVGAGTGLGVVYLTWEEGRRRVHSSEGGHADFAPRNRLEWELLEWLAARHGRVSWERVLSGPGLSDLYRFLRDGGEIPERDAVRREMERGDAARVISSRALDGTDPLSARALHIFVSAFGAHAGDLALTFQAEGGVFLAGGIAPAILPALRGGPFLDAFRAKGRLSALLERVPVRVVLNTDVGLLGAAAAAVRE